MSNAPATARAPSSSVRLGRIVFQVVAWLFVLSVAVQVFIAGMAVFDSPARWAWHSTFVHVFELLPVAMVILAFVGRLPVSTRWLSAFLFLLIGLQYATAAMGGIAGAFHPVNALVIFGIGLAVANVARRARA